MNKETTLHFHHLSAEMVEKTEMAKKLYEVVVADEVIGSIWQRADEVFATLEENFNLFAIPTYQGAFLYNLREPSGSCLTLA